MTDVSRDVAGVRRTLTPDHAVTVDIIGIRALVDLDTCSYALGQIEWLASKGDSVVLDVRHVDQPDPWHFDYGRYRGHMRLAARHGRDRPEDLRWSSAGDRLRLPSAVLTLPEVLLGAAVGRPVTALVDLPVLDASMIILSMERHPAVTVLTLSDTRRPFPDVLGRLLRDERP